MNLKFLFPVNRIQFSCLQNKQQANLSMLVEYWTSRFNQQLFNLFIMLLRKLLKGHNFTSDCFYVSKLSFSPNVIEIFIVLFGFPSLFPSYMLSYSRIYSCFIKGRSNTILTNVCSSNLKFSVIYIHTGVVNFFCDIKSRRLIFLILHIIVNQSLTYHFWKVTDKMAITQQWLLINIFKVYSARNYKSLGNIILFEKTNV